VCIIGGGYTGLSSALHLAEKGYDVVLLEANRVGWGASGRNGGHVGTGQRKGQDELEDALGQDRARQLWALGLEAVRCVRELAARYDMDCDLEEGILHVASKLRDVPDLIGYAEKLRTDYHFDALTVLDRDAVAEQLGTRKFYAGYIDHAAAHLHPLNYALGLAQACLGKGVRIYEASRVERYLAGNPSRIRTASGEVHASYVVFACNGYLGKLEPRLARKIMPINNFVLATEPLGEEGARALIRDRLAVEDSLFVINYWKLSRDNRLLFGGGENYWSHFPKDLKGFVRKYLLKIYPQLADTTIDYAWGGTLAVTVNRMPHFGRLDGNAFYAQGYSGHGVPIATLAGKLVSEVISGTAERFDVMAALPTPTFPGGTLLRWPGLVLGMLYYSLRDRL